MMDTSREQSEPVLQCSVPGGGDISALTLYKVWARKERAKDTVSNLNRRLSEAVTVLPADSKFREWTRGAAVCSRPLTD